MENKKSSFHQRRTLRKLVLCSKEFLQYLNNFEQWLRVFGFAQSTVYYSPAYLRSFFFFLEQKKIFQISSISNYHLVRYMQFLNERTNIRTRIKLSSSYRLNHLNAVKLFARYLRESQTGNIDASYRFSRDTSDVRNCLPNNTRHNNMLVKNR